VSINERDPKANEPTTFEDAEVEAHARHFRLSPPEQPEVEAQAKKHSSPAEQDPKANEPTTVKQPEVEGHGYYRGSPAEKAEKNRRGFH
jgi:hypothetical protein